MLQGNYGRGGPWGRPFFIFGFNEAALHINECKWRELFTG